AGFARRIARAGEFRRCGSRRYRYPKIAKADRPVLYRPRQSGVDQRLVSGSTRDLGDFRRRTCTCARAEPGELVRAQSSRSYAADTRYFRAARSEPGRPLADRAGSTAISFAASYPDVASLITPDRRYRHARPG